MSCVEDGCVHSSRHASSPVVTITFGDVAFEEERVVVDPIVRDMYLGVVSADVCRICHCGPNTLATPTPQILTPLCSPKRKQGEQCSSSSSSAQFQTAATTSTNPQLSSLLVSQLSKSHQDSRLSVQQPPLSQDYNLISPCVCSGSLKYVHQCCLQHWIRASNNRACELCKHPYSLRSKFKPLWEWESLPMSPGEKKRVVCSALFHTIALACVIWSLYVLIDRTVEELTHSDLEWQFWTKIIVEAIGCLGAGILTYVWGKSYVSLLVKWVTFNRTFVILARNTSDTNFNVDGTVAAQSNGQQPELIQLIK